VIDFEAPGPRANGGGASAWPGGCPRTAVGSIVTSAESLLGSRQNSMSQDLVRILSANMAGDLNQLHAIVATYVVGTESEQERAVLRKFGSELGAVQRRIARRPQEPTQEEIEIALTAVYALSRRALLKAQADS
jgi:hypothetical protein